MPGLGDRVGGKYRIDAVLGRGGMSVVYRATHEQLEQPVAIKVLSATALLLPEYVVRLEREARAVSHFRSEHIARVLDIGALDVDPTSDASRRISLPYVVMEYLEGRDLATVLLEEGPLSVERAVMCILQACEGLAEAHAGGLVHRDLKPANLFLTELVDGTPCVKVLDFGISRMARPSALAPLTDPGTVLGTPSYMAPEQMESSERVDARSDIWALGAILFELLTGRLPYAAGTLPQLFVRIMRSKTPKPSARRPGLPRALDDVVARCLAIDPDDRFQTVADFASALAPLGSKAGRASAERTARILQRCSGEIPPPPTSGVVAGKQKSRWEAAVAYVSAALLGVER